MPIGTEYRDVNVNRIKFEGKTTASVERNGKRNVLEPLNNSEENQLSTRFGLDGETGNNTGHR